MKISSAFIRATQARTVPKPVPPWEPVDRSLWTGGTIYPRWKTTVSFKYKKHKYINGEWVPQDEWNDGFYSQMQVTRVSNTGNGALIRAGDYRGMVPGLFYTDDTNINTNPNPSWYIRSPSLSSDEKLSVGTLTFTGATPNFYFGYFEPGTYKLEIIRYFGRPVLKWYNGNMRYGIAVENLIRTDYSYGENDYFHFDPEPQIYEGYRGESGELSVYRSGVVVKLTETHVFTKESYWGDILIDSIGLGTFCDGIRFVDYDTDGETELMEGYYGGQIEMITLQDFNLYKCICSMANY